MKLSTRNQLPATVTEVIRGEAMAVVKLTLSGGEQMVSSITNDAVTDLGLEPGRQVLALIKSTEVAMAVDV